MNASLDAIYNGFLQRVAQGRNMSQAQVDKVARGRIWSGQDALKHGLVDKLGDLTVAVDLAKQEAKIVDAVVEVFPQPLTLPQQILQLFNPDENDESVSVSIMQQLFASVVRSIVATKNWVLSNERTVEVDVSVH